jgi:hypothetical protein
MSLQKVKVVAKQVRKAMEEIIDTEPFGNDDLGGECGRASAQLYLACKRARIRGVKFASNHQHAFNVYRNHIIDITATQFGYKRRVFIKKITGKEKYFHEPLYIRRRIEDFDFISINAMVADQMVIAKKIGF